MVYIDPDELKWLPFVKSWAAKLPEKFSLINNDAYEFIIQLFETYLENGLTFTKKHCEYAIHQVLQHIIVLNIQVIETLFFRLILGK